MGAAAYNFGHAAATGQNFSARRRADADKFIGGVTGGAVSYSLNGLIKSK